MLARERAAAVRLRLPRCIWSPRTVPATPTDRPGRRLSSDASETRNPHHFSGSLPPRQLGLRPQGGYIVAARVLQYQPGPFTAFSLPMDSRARRTRAKNGALAAEIAALLLGVETLLARRRNRSMDLQCPRSVGRTPRVNGDSDSGPFTASCMRSWSTSDEPPYAPKIGLPTLSTRRRATGHHITFPSQRR